MKYYIFTQAIAVAAVIALHLPFWAVFLPIYIGVAYMIFLFWQLIKEEKKIAKDYKNQKR